MELATPFDGDLRTLPGMPPKRRERPEREPPQVTPVPLPGSSTAASGGGPSLSSQTAAVTNSAPAPSPLITFDGLDFATWGAGHPPDTNGDVGPTYYIQTVNTSIGIYRKSDGFRVAAFTFDTFMSQGNFGNLCDTDNFGDPVVLYDSFEDRWIITDFAFQLDASGNVINPPGSFQCFAVSKSGDPVSGGWNFYSINTAGGLGDYPKFGVWPDGLYMSANMFDYAASGGFQNVRLYAFNKAQMYAGAPSIQVISFDAPSTEFTLLPANARLQTGTPPTGSPNYYATVWNYLNAITVWKFHVDWNRISTSTLAGPFNVATSTWWAQYASSCSGGNPASNSVDSVPSPANRLDSLYPRLMVQNQYTNNGGIESVWNSHTVGAGNPTILSCSTQAGVRYYQVKVTGGNVESTATQSFTFSPDTTLHRFMPSAAVNGTGDLAIGYSGSNATTNPVMDYAGRLAADPANSITQTETTLIAGTGSQSGKCGGSTCIRWGDYSAMSVDPDGCTFWYTNEYYAVSGLNDLTRIGAFRFPTCTQSQLQTGVVQGSVTTSGNAISGAAVQLGSSRSTTTDGNGNYSFTGVPAGTYPTLSASYPGLNPGSTTNVVVTSGGTTVQNFSLTPAAASGCFTDTSQADFQTGVPSNCDLAASPGNVILASTPVADQQNTSVTNSGFGFTNTSWAGQTFLPAVSGKLTRIDLDLFCSGCTGTTSNITVSIRATAGSPPVPTGSDLAVATIPAFSSGSGGYFTASFSSPVTLTAGTTYAFIFRAATTISAGTYAYVCSCGSGSQNTNPYANGQRVISSNSGSSWTADTTAGGVDLGFVTYMQMGFASSGTFVSSLKDANPPPGGTPNWGSISWNATVPAGTTLQFQAAASTNSAGPFTFVGPDGTSATFFSNGASLAQFNGKRYLKYEALLTSADPTTTPTVSDVSVCFSNAVPPPAAPSISATAGNTQVALSWAAVTFATSYDVYRGSVAGGESLLKSGVTTAGYTDTAVSNGTTYYYKVSAVNSGGEGPLSNEVSATPQVPLSGGASFVKTDISTQGNWPSNYGADGFNVIGDTALYPSYATVTPSGQGSYTWASSTTDVRALQKAGANDRIAACWFSGSSFILDVNLTGGLAHQVAIYLLDWDSTVRNETITVSDAGTGTVFDTRTVSGFSNGVYLVWNITGHVRISVTNNGSGGNAVISGIFFGGARPQTSIFVKSDTTTQGNWQANYGADGFNVLGDTALYPSYATVTPSGQGSYTWASSTTDVRALQKVSASDRIAACWFSGGTFSLDVNLTDGLPHQVAIYLLDWDSTVRNETVTVQDVASGALLDTRTVSGFSNGVYLVWNITGHVKISLTNNAASNAVLSGLFFGGARSQASIFVKTDTTTQGNWKGVYGLDGYNVIADTISYPSYTTVNPSGQSSYTWASSTTDVRALQKASVNDRIAACWFSGTSFVIDINLTDGLTHPLELYFLDWDQNNRIETITVKNAVTGAVLDTRTISSFSSGIYLQWNVTGHVTITVTNSASGGNAVVSGIFFH
ncbi:MAG: carboxypeptidase regulatory-like domain-containing protein [Terriglobales bacterium]